MGVDPSNIALRRFGLGARPTEPAAIASDPKAWLARQIDPDAAKSPALRSVPPSRERVVDLVELRLQKRETKQASADAADPAKLKETQRRNYAADITARQMAAAGTEAPFAERWVRFWANHFTVSIARPVLAGLVVPFEVEAVRPHVFGRFVDLAMAVTRHPAMLLYLDNATSVGPDSPAGKRRDLGLNENLARELMELHTLGVDGGYSQQDVRALAEILTGWTIIRPGRKSRSSDGAPGQFQFQPLAHQPGAKTLLGRRFDAAGEQEGIAAIAMLAGHPATARHIAVELTRHFLADDPPERAIADLADTFARSGGDLAAMARRLIDLPESWSMPLGKLTPPEDWAIAIQRALNLPAPPGGAKWPLALKQLGQMPFAAPSPAGWPDRSEDWLGPEALMARLEFAHALAAQHPDVAPDELAQSILGSSLAEETKLQITRAPSRADALAMLLVSPEFMLR